LLSIEVVPFSRGQVLVLECSEGMLALGLNFVKLDTKQNMDIRNEAVNLEYHTHSNGKKEKKGINNGTGKKGGLSGIFLSIL